MDFPRIHREFALDLETYDPSLQDLGPGFVYNRAKVVGIAITTDLGESAYFPLRHAKANADGSPTGWNMPGEPVVEWLEEQLRDPMKTVIMHNGLYDLEGLWSMNIQVRATVIDTMILAALIDEERMSYSLANVAKDYGLEPKLKTEIENALMRFPLVKNEPDWSKLWKLPPSIVGTYAMRDTELTYQLYKRMWPEIIEQDLTKVAELESRLIPVLSAMRIKGVRVDYAKAERENERLRVENEELLQAIYGYVPGINPFSPAQLGEALRDRGIVPPETEKGNDSVSNDFLLSLKDDPLAQLLGQYRQQEKIRRDFIQGMILEGSYKGYLHPQWFQTRGSGFMAGDDVGGTRSGRIACSNPNLAQIPSRHPVLGKLVRSLFIPEDGERWWKGDAKQQEPRISVHYAYLFNCVGADTARQAYLDNPNLDYHNLTMDMVNKVRSSPITRNQAKTINLGVAYGMGKAKLAKGLGLSQSMATDILDSYNEGFPFMKELMNKAMQVADQRGYVKTVLGRRRRFDSWEPQRFMRGCFPVKGYEAAKAKYGPGIRKAGLHRAMNSAVQGSAAEMIKTAMVNAYDDGIPLLITLYDELGASIENEVKAKRLADIFETAIKFEVPQICEWELRKNWGEKE